MNHLKAQKEERKITQINKPLRFTINNYVIQLCTEENEKSFFSREIEKSNIYSIFCRHVKGIHLTLSVFKSRDLTQHLSQ